MLNLHHPINQRVLQIGTDSVCWYLTVWSEEIPSKNVKRRDISIIYTRTQELNNAHIHGGESKHLREQSQETRILKIITKPGSKIDTEIWIQLIIKI